MANTFAKKEQQETTKELSKKEQQETTKEPVYLTILSQAFYGNRTMTEISLENMDRFILGCLDSSSKIREPIDRTIVQLPGSDNLVLVYNKFREEKRLREKERLLEEENYELKPLAIIPELDLTLYSRCIALRMDKDGNFSSLQNGDGRILVKYLAR